MVDLGFLEVWELSGPSNHFLLACRKHTGSGPIPSRLGSHRSSWHWRNILPIPKLEQLLEEEEEVVGLDILGLALLGDGLVVELALEIRNGLHKYALPVLEHLLG